MGFPPSASPFGSWLLKRCLGPISFWRRLSRLVRNKVFQFTNSSVRADYYGQRFLFPGRHDLPLLVNDLPLFNTPLRRIARAVRACSSGLRMLDVGANIGDGVPLVDPEKGDQFWLVEGSSEFLPFLRENVSGYPNVEIIPYYLAEKHSLARASEIVSLGNASIVTGVGKELVFETLDRLFPADRSIQPNLLKIDVEGHEALIFEGGLSLLRRESPVIFMEWYPLLLLQAGFDIFSPIQCLLVAGFTEATIYDNHGFLLGNFSLDDRAHLQLLAKYAQMRDLFYYDMVVFGPKHLPLRSGFLASEEEFYETFLLNKNRRFPG